MSEKEQTQNCSDNQRCENSDQMKVRSLVSVATNILEKVADNKIRFEDVVKDSLKRLNSIMSTEKKMQSADEPIVEMNYLLDEAYQNLQMASSCTDGVSGLGSGFTKLDKITSGWQNSDLIVLAARPSMGKTSFVLSMLRYMAVESRVPVALFSLETNRTQVVNRFISNVCQIPSEKIRSGQLDTYEWQTLDLKLKEVMDAPLYIDDTPKMKIEELCRKACKLVAEKGVRLIVIDYVQLLYNEVRYTDNRYNEVNYFTRRLKSLAKELNVPIIILSQLNRGLESREGGVYEKRPQLTDLRDSGTLCDEADMVCFIHRPEYYKIYQDDRGNDLRGMAEIIIAKHRNGILGDVLLRFRGEFSRFSNPEEEDDMLIKQEQDSYISSLLNPDKKQDDPKKKPVDGLNDDGALLY